MSHARRPAFIASAIPQSARPRPYWSQPWERQEGRDRLVNGIANLLVFATCSHVYFVQPLSRRPFLFSIWNHEENSDTI